MKAKTNFLFHAKTLSKPPALLLVLLLGGPPLWAGDEAWKAKPYQQWNEKEIEVILTDSPWVRVTPIQRSWLPILEKDLPGEPAMNGGVRQMPNASTATTPSERVGEDTWRELNVQIYWQSSRVMRAATARQAVLQGEKVDVVKYANEPQIEYQIFLRMEDMTPFQQHDEKFFHDNAFLQMKRAKTRISTHYVVYEKNSKGLVANAIFLLSQNQLFRRSHNLL